MSKYTVELTAPAGHSLRRSCSASEPGWAAVDRASPVFDSRFAQWVQ
jgi:hypothetical protein